MIVNLYSKDQTVLMIEQLFFKNQNHQNNYDWKHSIDAIDIYI